MSDLGIDDNKVTEETLLKFGFNKIDNLNYELKISAIKMVCRRNMNRFYFELPGLYIGEINKIDRLRALYYGLTERTSPPKNNKTNELD